MESEGIINECWRSITGYVNYQVSKIGRVRNTDTGRIFTPIDNGRGYFRAGLSRDRLRKVSLVHRLVAQECVENPDNKQHVDHIDGSRTNICVSNLRWVNASENSMNQRKTSNHTSSKYKGVAWDSKYSKWKARITKGGKILHIGYFDNEKHAARVYNIKAIEMFGEYAHLNDVSDDEDDTELPPSFPT